MSKKKETQMETGQEEKNNYIPGEDKSEGSLPDDEKKTQSEGESSDREAESPNKEAEIGSDPKEKFDVGDDEQDETTLSEAYAALGDRYAESVREAEISLGEIEILKDDLAEARRRIKTADEKVLKLEKELESKKAAIGKLEKKLKKAQGKEVHDGKFMTH